MTEKDYADILSQLSDLQVYTAGLMTRVSSLEGENSRLTERINSMERALIRDIGNRKSL